MGKLTKKKEQRIWILSIAMGGSILIIALLMFYLPFLVNNFNRSPIPLRNPDDPEYLNEIATLSATLGQTTRNSVFGIFDALPLPWFVDVLDVTWLGLFLLLILPAYYYYSDFRWRQKIDENLPNLLREISDAQKTGLSLPRAIMQASKHQYGPLTPELKKMANQISWGVPFQDALKNLTENTDTNLMKQTALLILEAERAGGTMEDIFDAAYRHVKEVLGLRKERQASIAPYKWIILISFVIFTLVLIILLVTFFSLLTCQAITAAPDQREKVAHLPFTYAVIEMFFYHMLVIEALFTGLVAGRMGEENARLGLRFSLFLITFAYIGFKVVDIVFKLNC